MTLKKLFARNTPAKKVEAPPSRQRPAAKLEQDSLDHCVGGCAEAGDVGCYMRSVQSTVH